MTSPHRGRRTAGLGIREYAGGQALDFLACEWAGLTERDAAVTAYQDPAWLLGWARQLPHQPVVLAVLEGARPISALALVRETAPTGRTCITPLSWPACEQVRPVGESEEAASILIHRLPELADNVVVADLPEGSPLDRQAHRWWGRPDTEALYATIPLPVDLTGLSRSTRRDQVRRQRAVRALGGRVAYHRTSTGPELLAAYEVLEDLHRRRNALRLPTTGRTADLGLPWRHVLEECSSMAFIATLTLDGQAVAAQLCLRRAGRAYSVLTAMDPAHRDLAPGHALLQLLSEDLAEEGYTALDLGRTTAEAGQRSYKAAYGATWTTLRTYTAPAADGPHRSTGRAPQFADDLALPAAGVHLSDPVPAS
ncbi:GNAT family N-acetyltransferase [Streptomyces sp. NPDC055140]